MLKVIPQTVETRLKWQMPVLGGGSGTRYFDEGRANGDARMPNWALKKKCLWKAMLHDGMLLFVGMSL